MQEGELERLGSPTTFKVDVRVIAATNRDLEKAMAKGDFPESLYYRLNVFPIKVPPLRAHKEDITLVVRHFTHKFCATTGKRIESVPKKVMDALEAHDWPGNVRELENIVERATILSSGKQLELRKWFSKEAAWSDRLPFPTLDELEKQHIIKTIELTRWRVRGEKGAAKILGLKPTTLEARMKKLGIMHKR